MTAAIKWGLTPVDEHLAQLTQDEIEFLLMIKKRRKPIPELVIKRLSKINT